MNKDQIILDYLMEQKSYLEIAEAIIKTMDDKVEKKCKDVIIIRDWLGMIYEER